MKRTMDSTKRNGTKAWTESVNGPSVWLHPAGGQFYTRSCTRCARLLPNARSYDPAGPENPEAIRCVQCRDLIDSMILSNQNTRRAANDFVRCCSLEPSASYYLLC